MTAPYNPLDKVNLARSIETELLDRDPLALSDVDSVVGAGVYVIYYTGDFEAYAPIRSDRELKLFERPIYVGKAIPKGGRKGGLTKDAGRGTGLRDRLRDHASSIAEACNLELGDFWVRHLVVDDVWIPLGENMLIETFKPVWNVAIDGFGNHDPGTRRSTQFRSPWDVLHPGRGFATKLADSPATVDLLIGRVGDHFGETPLRALPKKIRDQIEETNLEAEREADEAPF